MLGQTRIICKAAPWMTRLGLTLLPNKLFTLTYTLLYSSLGVALSDRYQQRVTYACVFGALNR